MVLPESVSQFLNLIFVFFLFIFLASELFFEAFICELHDKEFEKLSRLFSLYQGLFQERFNGYNIVTSKKMFQNHNTNV